MGREGAGRLIVRVTPTGLSLSSTSVLPRNKGARLLPRSVSSGALSGHGPGRGAAATGAAPQPHPFSRPEIVGGLGFGVDSCLRGAAPGLTGRAGAAVGQAARGNTASAAVSTVARGPKRRPRELPPPQTDWAVDGWLQKLLLRDLKGHSRLALEAAHHAAVRLLDWLHGNDPGWCASNLPGLDAIGETDRALGYFVQQSAAKLGNLRNAAVRYVHWDRADGGAGGAPRALDPPQQRNWCATCPTALPRPASRRRPLTGTPTD